MFVVQQQQLRQDSSSLKSENDMPLRIIMQYACVIAVALNSLNTSLQYSICVPDINIYPYHAQLEHLIYQQTFSVTSVDGKCGWSLPDSAFWFSWLSLSDENVCIPFMLVQYSTNQQHISSSLICFLLCQCFLVCGLVALRPGIRLQSWIQGRENVAKSWRMDCHFTNVWDGCFPEFYS